MKTFNKIISLALCVFMLCSVMVMPAFATTEEVGFTTDTSNPKMLMTEGDIGTQVHWAYADGVLTISKPDGFTGEWTSKVATLDTTVTVDEKTYCVACPWGKYAFNANVEPEGNTFAGKYTPSKVDYSHIKKLVIEEGVKIIPAYTFYNNMYNAKEAGQVTTPLKPVSHTALAEVVLPSTLETIGYTKIENGIDKSYSSTFSGCTSLTKVNFADATSLKHIYSGAFADCPITGKVVMPKSLTVLGATAFRTWDKNCGEITQFIVPAESKITSIGVGTFDAQDKLEYVVLPASVTSIGNYSFRKHNDNAAVKKVIFLGNAPTISTGVAPFANTTKVYYSDKATGWDSAAVTTNTGLKAENVLKVSGIPSIFTDCGGINTTGLWFYDSASKTLDICGNGTAHWAYNERPWGTTICAEVENVRINDGVDLNEKGVYYFKANSTANADKDCPNIKTMYIGKDVKKVPDQFMNAKNLTKLTFSPESKLTAIVGNAFLNHQLEEIILPDTVEAIGNMAFDMYSSTNIKLKKLYLGTSLKTIGAHAFRKCKNLESVVIPATVTSIGTNAFANESSNTTGLKVVYFKGKIPENALSVGANNVTTVFNNNYQAQFYVTDPEDEGKVFKMSEYTSKTTKLMPKSKIDASITMEADGTAKARIYNFSDASKRFDLYSAAYDSNLALTAVTTNSATVAAGNKIPVITDLSTTTSGATKAFLWDSNLAPFAVYSN